nr:1,4-alpha-glucan branching enzyme [bacterium]
MDKDFRKIEKALFATTNPHGYLGLVAKKYVYQLSPNAQENFLIVHGKKERMEQIDPRGIFVYESEEELSPKDYQVIHSNGLVGYDPYSCSPSLSMVDVFLFDRGENDELYKMLGAHSVVHDGIEGIRFAVFAGDAKCVHLRCDLGNWREAVYPMRKVSELGVFELFIPGAPSNMMYKFSITARDGSIHLKADPFAACYELRPKSASITYKEQPFKWEDKEWLEARKTGFYGAPLNVYELHLGAWAKEESFVSFRKIAPEVVAYVKEMGYTHVELLPITEYPLDESWGYQVVGFFAPTARYGSREDFKFFVNYLHANGIGLVFDFVPAHFPKDPCFLANFNGSALFEKDHPVMGTHPEWTTNMFDYASPQVVNFLLAAALFWVEEMHVDMIRVDAVQAILYLDHQRGEEFEPNHMGGVEHFEGIAFLQKLTTLLQEKHPDVQVIAEDPSLFDGVTRSVDHGGLGFSMKWNIGWKHDLFHFLRMSEAEKKENYQVLLNSYKEVFRERYMLSISHDDVSGGAPSLLYAFSKSEEEGFALLRLLYGVAMMHPGKKLFFMGHEVGEELPFTEKDSWRKKGALTHRQIKHKSFVKACNHLYLSRGALHEMDFDEKGFAWID